jgi:hypothetical protein
MATQIEVIKGTTVPVTFTVSQSGTAVNLTGKELVFVAGTTPNIVKKTGTGGSGFVVTNAAGGIAVLTLTVAETRAFTSKLIPFTIELWESSGTTQTVVVEGELKVREVINTDA